MSVFACVICSIAYRPRLALIREVLIGLGRIGEILQKEEDVWKAYSHELKYLISPPPVN